MPTYVEWRTKPIVRIKKNESKHITVHWYEGLTSQSHVRADEIEIKVRFKWENPYGGWVKFKVVVLFSKDGGAHFTTINYAPFYKNTGNSTDYEDVKYKIPFNTSELLFRVCVAGQRTASEDSWTDPMGYDNDNYGAGLHPNHSLFTAYSEYLGQFALDYIPITLLYCPPGQDMYNALNQTYDYGTVISMGFKEEIGLKKGERTTIKGGGSISLGMHIKNVAGGTGTLGVRGADTDAVEEIETHESYMENKMSCSYQWSTTLIADNQNIIGRRYFGPLGDIFLLIKNPYFSVLLDDLGNPQIISSDLTLPRAEIIAVPAHRLLRPGNDPIAKAISPAARKRLLTLDPFIVNLDQFFPVSEADPTIILEPDPNIPLEVAVDPYIDPTAGNFLLADGENRAELIAKYSISNGIELDLSKTTAISLVNINSNTSTYYSAVTDIKDLTAFTSTEGGYKIFHGASEASIQKSWSETHFVKLTYHNSIETHETVIKNAICKLLKNQNASDLNPIKVYYDKLFSTFMFSSYFTILGTITGVVFSVFEVDYGPTNARVINAPVILFNMTKFFEWQPEFVKPLINDKESDVDGIIDEIIKNDKINYLETKFGRAPPFIAYKTNTDNNGNYTINNLKEGKYLMIVGDQKKKIIISEKDLGRVKTLDFKNVKRFFDLRNPTLWELQEIFFRKTSILEKIMVELKNAKNFDRDSWIKILSKEKLSINAFEERAFTDYNEIKVRPNSILIEGWITNPLEKAVKLATVVIIENSVLKEEFPEFFENPNIPIDILITKIPRNKYHHIGTNYLGHYSIQNISPGQYQIIVGNTRTEVDITKIQVQSGCYKRIDIENVKSIFKPKIASLWEIKTILDINVDKAKKLKLRFSREEKLDDNILTDILKKENISIQDLKKSMIIDYKRKEKHLTR